MMHGRKVGFSRKCTLPSEYLTAAQKRKLNGEVITVNLNRPMKWAEFKQLNKELQTMYAQNLVRKFGVTAVAMAEMLGVSKCTVYTYAKGVWGLRSRMTAAETEAFLKFCSGEAEEEPEEAPTAADTPEEAPTTVGAMPAYFPAKVEHMTVALRGSIYFCAEYLRALPLGEGDYIVNIEITKETET